MGYEQEQEADLLRAAQFYEQERNNPKGSPESRAFAQREFDAIGNEFQRRSPITVTEEPSADVSAAPLAADPSSRGEPGDPGPPLVAPKGVLAGNTYSPEKKYGVSDLKADARTLAGVLAPGLGMVNRKLESDEARARAEAGAVATQEPAPQGVDIAALREAEAALAGGGGPSMGVSTTTGNTNQVERKLLPPEWYKSLERYTAEARNAAVGGTAEALALMDIQRRAAERRRSLDQDFRQGVEESALREASALAGGRRRIASAIERFRAGGPRYESVGTVLKEARGGAGVAGGIGLVLGIIGAAATGRANGFTEAVNQNIERRARIAELESEREGRAIGFEGEQYRRLQSELGDARAAKAMVRAMYLDELKTEIEEKGAQVGIMAGDARLSVILAQIEQQRLSYLEKAAAIVMNQQRSEQTVAPIKGDKSGASGSLPDYIEERRKRGMDTMEGGIRLMENGVKQIKQEGPGFVSSTAFRQVMADPSRWSTAVNILGQVTPGEQAFINGFLQFLASDAGKALTDSERQGVASALGSGKPEALSQFIANSQTRLDALERGLVPQYGDAIKLYRIRQQIHDAENPRKVYDVRGVETQPPVTERPPVRGGP